MARFKEFYLMESPDRIGNIWHKTPSARTFGYINNNLFVSKSVTNHPDFAIHLLNSKQITFDQLPKQSQESGSVDRNSFKYAGRLWTTEKIISFWQFPNKSDFDKLITDLKKNGINADDTWKVDVEAGPISILEPITNYSNKFKDIKVKQVDHILDPIAKQANKSNRPIPGSVHKYQKVVPKDWSIAKYNHMVKQESLEENKKVVNLKSLSSEKIKELDYHTFVFNIVKAYKDKDFSTIKHVAKQLNRSYEDAIEDIKNVMKTLKENVPTSVAPTSVSTGQFQKKLGDVASRPIPDQKEYSKDKIKKKIKDKLKNKSDNLDKYLKP
jgi:hypothetical protein